jgi:hypothetical protein
MFDNCLGNQIREDRNGLIIQIAFPLHPPPHTLASLSFFHPLSLSGLEVHGMLLDLFDDRFLLNSTLEPPESTFQGFSVLNNDKSQ